MKLADVTPAPQEGAGGTWSDVIEASTDRIGANPRAVWIDALEQAGSAEGKQDLSSEEYTTRCPAHDDTKASLRWREEADGQILFTCRADCDGEAVIKAVGLRWNQLKWAKTQYLYRDQDRRLMAAHTKTSTKTFSWLHPASEQEKAEGTKVDRFGLAAGRGGDWVSRLWLWPDTVQWADQAREEGKKVHLWLCYSPDTEVLTPSGWTKLPALSEGTQVAQYDRDSEQVSFTYPLARQVLDYDGPMIQFDSKASNLLVTPDHRTLTKYRHAGKVTVPASEIKVKRLLPVSGIKVGGTADWSPTEARLWAAWQADGVKPSRGHQGGWNIKRADKNERLLKLLSEAGVSYQTSELGSRPGFTWTKIDMRSNRVFAHKQFDWSLLDWTYETRIAFLEELRYWDGEPNSESGRAFRFFTSYEPSADIVTAVASISGWAASKRTYSRLDRPASQTEYSVTLNPGTTWREMTKPAQIVGPVVGGRVYCLSVPSTYLIVRRNGRVSISGNCEGEKDVEHVTRAIETGWGVTRGESEQDGWTDLVSTAPDGVAWGPELSADVLRLGAAKITILADNDPGGVGRANKIVAGLQQEMSASGVRAEIEALGWLISGIKDATDALIKWGRSWLSKAVAVADADEYGWSSHRTGWLYETEAIDKDGAGTGELALGRIIFGPKGHHTEIVGTGSVRVRAVLVDEQGNVEGWELETGGRECVIKTRNLAGSGLSNWNARDGGGLFIVSSRGIAEPFGAYLRHHGARAPKVLCYEHEGWVTDEVFVAANGVIVNTGLGSEAIGAKVERVAGLWHFGLDGPDGEIGAAQRLVELLSFRDADESGPLLAWLAGVAARPYALRGVGAGAVPVLQCVGTSGHGKTRFLELACRLFGLKNSAIGATTGPGLIRVLASSTAVVWVDDASLDEYQQNLLRGSVTGGGRTRGNIDGDKGVTTDKSVAAVLYSAEAGFRLNEKAMRERTAVVRFDKPVQSRRSQVKGREREPQYNDMLALGSGQANKAELLTGYAGLVVQGLARTAGVGGWGTAGLDETGLREAGAYRFCLWGAELLKRWLDEVAVKLEDESRDGGLELRTAGEALVDGVTEWAGKHVKRAVAAERSGINHYLVTELIPRYLAVARRAAIKNHLGYIKVHEHEQRLRESDIKDALRDAWRLGVIGRGGISESGSGLGTERPPSPVVILIDQTRAGGDSEDGIVGIAVSGVLLYSWATSKHGADAGISKDVRHVGSDAILAQVAEVSAKEIGSQRVIVGSEKQRIGYRLLNPEVVAQVLALSEE